MSGKRIFIVEDERTTALVLQHQLARLGHEIVGNVASGEDALKQIEDAKADLVLMNIKLAGKIDGIELADALHSKYGLPVIFVTAYSDRKTLARVKVSNACGFILKPFTDEELQATIEIGLYEHGLEVKLKQSEEQYRSLFDDAPVGYHEVDLKGNVARVNRTELEMLGYEAADMIGRLVWDFVEEHDAAREAVMEKLSTGEISSHPFERNYLRHDGRTIPVLVKDEPIRSANGKLLGIRSTILDISVLKEEQARVSSFFAIAEKSIIGIIIADQKGILHYLNPAAEELLGLRAAVQDGSVLKDGDTKETLSAIVEKSTGGIAKTGQKEYTRRVTPVVAHILKHMEDVKTGNKPGASLETNIREIDIMRAGGDRGTGEVRVTHTTWEGKLAYLISVYDITERERTEKAFQESEKRLSATLRSIGDGVISTDVAGNVTGMNMAAEMLTGWTNVQAVGRPVSEVFHIINTQTRVEAKNPVKRVLTEGRVIGLANHTTLIARDGTERQIADSCAPISSVGGQVIGAVFVFRDVTAEYVAREQLKQANERYEQLARHSRAVTWEVDTEGLYTYVSHVSKIVWGYQPNELIGKKHFYNLHPKTGREAFKAAAFKVFARKEPFLDFENAVQTKEGRVIWVVTNGIPILDKNGKLVGYHGTDTDNTQRKKAEEELKALHRLKDEWLANVSHELRTPLSIIKEGVSLVLDKVPGKINEKQSVILTAAKSNIDRLARIIDDLLDSSKIESDKMQLKRKLLDIVKVVKPIIAGFKLRAKRNNLKLRTDFSAKDIKLYADHDKVVQIFTNLIENALKFTEKGWIKISVKELKDCVKCSVADTGIGISKNDLPRVFSKFQQFSRVNGPGGKGTGLGLSIVKGLIDIHQGKIWVESKQGSGTKFTFTFPKNITSIIQERA